MIHSSLYTDIAIPVSPLTPFVLRRARQLADKPALIDGSSGRTITYEQLNTAVRQTAASLAARGFRKGDVFAIFSPNLPEYAVAFHAVSLIGGTVTTINSLYTIEEVVQQLTDAGAKYLLTVPQLMEVARAAAAACDLREVFVCGEAAGATGFASLLGESEEVPEVQIDARTDAVALPYSSGTTGLAKGVMLTHYNLVANLCQIDALKHITEQDTLIGVLPFFHIYGMTVIMNMGLCKGATIVTMPRFSLEQLLQIIQDHRVTLAHLVPPVVLALTHHRVVDGYDLSSLHTIFSGAAPLGENVTRACRERLRCQIKQGYGMTETSPVTHMIPGDYREVEHGSVGLCVPNTECRIVDGTSGADLGVNEAGELWVRGPQIMKGYLHRPEATAATIDPDGWLHTGDIGYVDEAHRFHIVDRMKELIKYKGFQVAPAELEAILLAHPSVADAAVIPSPDPDAGEVPKAFVVLKGEATGAEIMAFVAGRVAPHKRVRRIEIIGQIPKSASGKILRRVLVERERAQPISERG